MKVTKSRLGPGARVVETIDEPVTDNSARLDGDTLVSSILTGRAAWRLTFTADDLVVLRDVLRGRP